MDWRSSGVRVVRAGVLDASTAQTPGMDRRAAITPAVGATQLWGGTVDIAAGAATGVHHHGSVESIIYVLSGRARMRWGDSLELVAEAEAGDFMFVPPYVPHQEINALAGEELKCVIVRSQPSTPGDAVIVNLPDVTPVDIGATEWIDAIHPAGSRTGHGAHDAHGHSHGHLHEHTSHSHSHGHSHGHNDAGHEHAADRHTHCSTAYEGGAAVGVTSPSVSVRLRDKYMVHPLSVLSNGFEFSVHTPPPAFLVDLKGVLPDVPLGVVDGITFFIVPTAQRSLMELVEWGPAAAAEKDLLLERFFEWTDEVIRVLRADGFWADAVDPCSGLARATPHSNMPYPEVDAFETLLRWRTNDAAGCKVRELALQLYERFDYA